MPEWDPQQYLKFNAERSQPSFDLVARLKSYRTKDGSPFLPATALDLGCGPGNSTAIVANAFPEARVLGVDSSADMIREAAASCALPASRVSFQLFDALDNPKPLAREFGSGEGFNLIFSNACIQWVPNNEALIKRFLGALAPGGLFAVQVPVNASEPINRCIYRVVDSDRWAPCFARRRFFTTLQELEYFDVLASAASDFTIWKTTYMHRMPSMDAVVEWFRGTGLRPFLEQLQPEQRPQFLAEVREELSAVAKPRPNGEVVLPFPRLFFIAQK